MSLSQINATPPKMFNDVDTVPSSSSVAQGASSTTQSSDAQGAPSTTQPDDARRATRNLLKDASTIFSSVLSSRPLPADKSPPLPYVTRFASIRPPHSRARIPGNCARPRYLIYDGRLRCVNQDPSTPPAAYAAISYTWDPNPKYVMRWGRRVTTQALLLAAKMAECTPYPLWIDAICIWQDNEQEKQEELRKMGDIYRGAAEVLCFLETLDSETCSALDERAGRYPYTRGTAGRDPLDATEGPTPTGRDATEKAITREKLVKLFAPWRRRPTPKEPMKKALTKEELVEQLFAHRWWERAWTFQEAMLNPETYLVGIDSEWGTSRYPIVKALQQYLPVLEEGINRANVMDVLPLCGRGGAFWDGMRILASAKHRRDLLHLGDAMRCVWRRDASLEHDLVYSLVGIVCLDSQVEPSYRKSFDVVLLELYQAAISVGDYTWIPWCFAIPCRTRKFGMGLIPKPEHIVEWPVDSSQEWRNVSSSKLPIMADYKLPRAGVTLPLQDLGTVQSCTMLAPLDTVAHLRELGLERPDMHTLLSGSTLDGLSLPERQLLSNYFDVTRCRTKAWDELAKMRLKCGPEETPRLPESSLFVISCQESVMVLRADWAALIGAGAVVAALPVQPENYNLVERVYYGCIYEETNVGQARVLATAPLYVLCKQVVDRPWRVRDVV